MARDQAAAEELEQLLSDGVSAEEAGEFAALVGLATAVRENTSVPVPDPAFRATLRETLLKAPPPAPVTSTGLQRMAEVARDIATRIASSGNAVIATATTAGLIGATGLVVAGQDALPGEALRPLRDLTESTRLALASDLADRGLLQLQFATSHLQDLVDNLDELSLDEIGALLDLVDELALEGTANVLLGAIERGQEELLDEIDAFTSVTTARLQALITELPAATVGLARQTISALEEIDGRVSRARVQETITPGTGDDPVPTLPTDDPTSGDPSDTPTSTPTSPVPTDLPSDVTDLPSDVTDLPSDVTDLPTDITDLPTDVTELPSDVTEFPTDATDLPSELTTDDPVEELTEEPVATLSDVIDDVLGG